MDSSFELLSTMSPKISKPTKNTSKKKVPTVLSLRKQITGSVAIDEMPRTIQNEGLIIVEDSFTDSTNSSCVISVVNSSPIVISDTESSDIDETQETDRISNEDRANIILPSKLTRIESWIRNINLENRDAEERTSGTIDYNDTNFTEVSSIYDNSSNNVCRRIDFGKAINSTFNDKNQCRFDELFKKLRVGSNKNIEADEDVPKAKSDEHHLGSDKTSSAESFKTAVSGSVTCLKPERSVFDPESRMINGSNGIVSSEQQLSHRSHFNDISDSGSESDSSGCDKSYENMLDQLYGEDWRQNKYSVLPKSERKRRNKVPVNRVPKTEVKQRPKISDIYKNPYTISDHNKRGKKLLETLHSAKIRAALESPWVKRLENLCDSDSSSGTDSGEIERTCPHIKLVFDDESSQGPHLTSSNRKLRHVYSNSSDKENGEFSDIEDSLEDRVKKKFDLCENIEKKEEIGDKCSENGREFIKPILAGSVIRSKNKLCRGKDQYTGNLRKGSSQLSFLASLSATALPALCDPSAKLFKNNYKEYKFELAEKLFRLYNKSVFDDAIPHDTPLEWSERMRGTAGYCYCKKITRSTGTVERKVRIQLASKVLDSADRLRDTLVHEMCHAATWIVNEISDGHGSFWRGWADKAMTTFPELPPIKRCHEYVINTKFTYKCTTCGYSIGRHSKSLDTERKRCGYCYGTFEVLINKVNKKNGAVKSVPATPKREATGFALFVKENYGDVKTPDLKHGDVMRILGKKFSSLKVGEKSD